MVDQVYARRALAAGVQLARKKPYAIDNLTTPCLRQLVSSVGQEAVGTRDRASLLQQVNSGVESEVNKQWSVQNGKVRAVLHLSIWTAVCYGAIH